MFGCFLNAACLAPACLRHVLLLCSCQVLHWRLLSSHTQMCHPPSPCLQAVCLWGWDLPCLLPDTAALPRLQLLPSLVDDVAAALRHAERQLARHAAAGSRHSTANASSGDSIASEHSSGDSAAATRAVRWALKRCLRAAFELASCCGSENDSRSSSCDVSGDSSSSSSSGDSSSAAGASRVFTRDLYWCQHYAAARFPQLRPQLAAALELYVSLDGGPAEASAAAASSGQQQQQVQAGVDVAAGLAAALDSLFLQAMLQPEPGWLTHHFDSTLAAPPAGGVQPAAAGASGSSSRGSRGGRWQQMKARLWAAAAAARGGSGMEDGLVGSPPPPVTVAVNGSVLTLDWRQSAAREQAARIIAATAAGLGCSGSSGALEPQPVLLKGAAAHWPAVQHWTLGHLATARLEGRARVAPSLQFPFTELRLAALVAEQQGGRVGEACGWGSCGVREVQWAAVHCPTRCNPTCSCAHSTANLPPHCRSYCSLGVLFGLQSSMKAWPPCPAAWLEWTLLSLRHARSAATPAACHRWCMAEGQSTFTSRRSCRPLCCKILTWRPRHLCCRQQAAAAAAVAAVGGACQSSGCGRARRHECGWGRRDQ